MNYFSAHSRIRKTRGPASEFPCVDCGQQAETWSFESDLSSSPVSGYVTDGTLRPVTFVGWFSSDPADYRPRCRSCHRHHDQGTTPRDVTDYLGGTCPEGHDFNERNTYVSPRGEKVCRSCRAAGVRRWRARVRGEMRDAQWLEFCRDVDAEIETEETLARWAEAGSDA